MRQYSEYELTQVPTALFKGLEMRKSNKSSLTAILRKGVPFVAEVSGAKMVLDGGYLRSFVSVVYAFVSLWNNTLPMSGKDMEHLQLHSMATYRVTPRKTTSMFVAVKTCC